MSSSLVGVEELVASLPFGNATMVRGLALALVMATTPAEVAEVVAGPWAAAVGATRAGVYAYEAEESVLQAIAHSGMAPECAVPYVGLPVTAALPMTDSFRGETPMWLESHDAYAAAYPASVCAARGAGERGALVVLPLECRARVLGVVAFGYATDRPFEDVDKQCFVVVARLVATALDRARRHERAESAIERLRLLLAAASHELRNPLSSVVGWANILAARAPDEALLQRGLDVIRRNADTQSRIIDDLLDVSRIETGTLRLELAPLDVTSVLAEAVEVLRPFAEEKRISAAFHPPVGSAWVMADRDRLLQIVGNLFANAVKFTPAGGRIDLRVERTDASVRISVSDDGVGVEEELLPFVFDPFRQGRASAGRREGLGLGLTIVRDLVDLHGGRVRAESEGCGRGTTITVSLRAIAAALPSESASAS